MGVNWLQTGASSVMMAQQDQEKRELEKATRPTLWRFFLKDGETDALITFLDGELITIPNVGQVLAPPRVYEHNLSINGKFGNHFVCPQHTLPQNKYVCPICEAGDQPGLIAVFTIIDHREVFSGDGKKSYKDMKRLFVAPPTVVEQLQQLAVTHGGLTGCVFKVSRIGANSSRVGNVFEFVEKNELAAIQAVFLEEVEVEPGKKVVQTYATPADYQRELPFLTPEDIHKLGVAAYAGAARSFGGSGATSHLKPGGAGGGFLASKAAGAKPIVKGGQGMDFSKEL